MQTFESILARLGALEATVSFDLECKERFLDIAARFAAEPGTVVLMSGGQTDCARYHVLCGAPWLALRGGRNEMTLDICGRRHRTEGDPFDLVERIVQQFQFDCPTDSDGPVIAGLFGYWAYDLKDCIEDLPRTSVNDLGLPDLLLYAPSWILTRRIDDGYTRIHIPRVTGMDGSPEHVRAAVSAALAQTAPPETGFRGASGGFQSNFTKTAYERSIEKIIAYIAAGDVYQVNMSQRFDMEFSGDPFALFRQLFEDNPAPFFAYINAGDHQIVSTSPERFIRREGTRVETRPIKGTRPRGSTSKTDRQMGAQLLQSRKDDAELSMIVDLLRNDLGKVCRQVRVLEHKRLEPYQNVFHLVSVVEGELSGNRSSVDLIKAVFPGGSITGCPKIRSMEIIDELEPTRRHVYTGAIGYVGFHDALDLSIAIRTATIWQNRIFFSVGGGIVYDSTPSDEYEETLHKGNTLMKVFETRPRLPKRVRPVVWQNGRLIDAERAAIPAEDPGALYGYGLFETLRVDSGVPRLLDRHLNRFESSWRYLFGQSPPDVTWSDVIQQVIDRNNLASRCAAVKIIAAKGRDSGDRWSGTLLVTARPYLHRLIALDRSALRLAVYPHARMSPLADHKTVNYLYYYLAGQWAAGQGADEALVLNPDGSISETNTANIFAMNGRTVLRPASEHVLAGAMESAVMENLGGKGYTIRTCPVFPGDLPKTEGVFLSNSLMGLVCVESIDNRKCSMQLDLCRRINRSIFGKAGSGTGTGQT